MVALLSFTKMSGANCHQTEEISTIKPTKNKKWFWKDVNNLIVCIYVLVYIHFTTESYKVI